PVGTEPVRNRVDERGHVVMRLRFDLRDPSRARHFSRGPNLSSSLSGDDPDLRPRVEHGQFDVEPARELALVRPDPGHLRSRVARDHCSDCMDGACGYPPPWARIRAARIAAFRAPSSDTHATGTPGGICAIASSASSPPPTLFDERSGTPITGRSLYAATTPGKAAAMPAPAMITRTPRS